MHSVNLIRGATLSQTCMAIDNIEYKRTFVDKYNISIKSLDD